MPKVCDKCGMPVRPEDPAELASTWEEVQQECRCPTKGQVSLFEPATEPLPSSPDWA